MTRAIRLQPRRLGRRCLMAAALLGASLASMPRAYADAVGVDAPLQKLYGALQTTMHAGRNTPFQQRFDLLNPVIDQVFDLRTVLRLSVGPKWESLGAEAQGKLLNVYRRFTTATYVANFDKYDGETFRILPGARDNGADRIVNTEIVGSNGDTTRLDYLMRDEQGGWRVVDILLDGSISRVAVQRSDFRKILANGNVDTLIASLRKKISDLSEGALSS